MIGKAQLAKWKREPLAFVREVLVDPETGLPFELYAEEEQFLREALTLTADGRLPFTEIVFAAGKKSGKTTIAAIATITVVVCLGGLYAEAYCVANSFDQAQGRVFKMAERIVEASPLLRGSAKITANTIEFRSTGSIIMAIPSDYSSAAGSNPTLTVFDELWAYVGEAANRLWDKMVSVPTRKISARLTVTYAGFEGESDLLEGLYKSGIKGDEIAPSLYRSRGMLMAWHHKPIAPWQTPDWIEQMRRQLRPTQFLRMIENRWVTSESSFVEMDWWDACVDASVRPIVADPNLPVWLGVDASTKRDSTAIVACTWEEDTNRCRLVFHRIFQPTKENPLDFEETVESTLLEMRDQFDVREIRYDPYQLVAVAQRLTKAGLPMVEFPQSVPNLTEASSNLYELVKGRNLVAYPDAEIRLSMSRAIAIETTRGWRIAKEKARHKIDVIVALAQAAYGATRNQSSEHGIAQYYRERAQAAARGEQIPEDTVCGDAYFAVQDEIRAMDGGGICPKCGDKLGATKTMNSDGKYYHPGCCPRW
jgi:phage terminase large subunit-like protein